MSSHHIVRDEQEPALLISDPFALSLEMVESLLEWSPTVVVQEEGLKEVLRWGIKIDVVVANYTSIEALKPRLQEQSPVKLLGFESGDLLKNGLQFLMDHNYRAMNVMADIYNSKVLDYTRSYSSQLDVVVFHNSQKWVYAPSGFFEKWVSAGHQLGVHPIVPNTFFTADGFFESWSNEMLMEPIGLTAELSGKVRLQTNTKPLWVVEELADSEAP